MIGPESTWYRIGFLKIFIVLIWYSSTARVPLASSLISVLPTRDLFVSVSSTICAFVSSNVLSANLSISSRTSSYLSRFLAAWLNVRPLVVFSSGSSR
jgi:hypothetical protein